MSKNTKTHSLNKIPVNTVTQIKEVIELYKSIKDTQIIYGPEWENIFAKAVGATKCNSSNTKCNSDKIIDLQKGNIAWSAKTIAPNNKPFNQKTVELISGRISVVDDFPDHNVKTLPPYEVGRKVIEKWNKRAESILDHYDEIRVTVFLRAQNLKSATIFEVPTGAFDPDSITWQWNKNLVLVGFIDEQHKFSWQPSGGQFRIKETVPDQRHNIIIA